MQNPQDKSALGLDNNVTVLLGYLFWIVALILIFIEKDNKFVRFHAFQSVFWGVAVLVAAIVAYILAMVIFFAGTILGVLIDSMIGVPIVTMIMMIIGIIVFVLVFVVIIGGVAGSIIAAIQGFNGKLFKLPLIGKWADKYSG